MKYGILTFHNIPNIGALLQAYGLCKAMRDLGADCEIIDYTCENIKKRELTYHPKSNIIKDILGRYFWRKTKKKINGCRQFMLEQHIFSKEEYNINSISESTTQYDALVCGSDMIWNLDVTGYDFTFFLEFASDKVLKYSYGSSIGEKWKNEDISKIRKLLLRYNGVSVRESDTCEMINHLGIKCTNVADPTMLLTTEEWNKLSVLPSIKDYVLVYFPSKENKEAAKTYAKKHGKKLVLINMWLPSPGFINVCPFTPPEWIGYFQNASAVFTDSYHGLLFSLYFQKPVWSGNYGNRIVSLLERMGLDNCLIKNDPEFTYVIDYNKVNKLIERFRNFSLNYISKTILN